LGQNLVGEISKTRRATFDTFPANDSPKWFNIFMYTLGACPNFAAHMAAAGINQHKAALAGNKLTIDSYRASEIQLLAALPLEEEMILSHPEAALRAPCASHLLQVLLD
jgi:hypothetical protein